MANSVFQTQKLDSANHRDCGTLVHKLTLKENIRIVMKINPCPNNILKQLHATECTRDLWEDILPMCKDQGLTLTEYLGQKMWVNRSKFCSL